MKNSNKLLVVMMTAAFLLTAMPGHSSAENTLQPSGGIAPRANTVHRTVTLSPRRGTIPAHHIIPAGSSKKNDSFSQLNK